MIVVTELTKRIVKPIGEDEEIRLVLGVLLGFKLSVGRSWVFSLPMFVNVEVTVLRFSLKFILLVIAMNIE